ncbi:hypothetical protein IWQ61_000031 [Dispira simplex]|nr:hypothetical protein IWQ61_000031 [Dispira simplex]
MPIPARPLVRRVFPISSLRYWQSTALFGKPRTPVTPLGNTTVYALHPSRQFSGQTTSQSKNMSKDNDDTMLNQSQVLAELGMFEELKSMLMEGEELEDIPAEDEYQLPVDPNVTDADEVKSDFDSALCSTEWLEENLDKVIPVDGSWVMPFSRRDLRDEWLQCHLPKARFLDIERLSAKHPILPHPLPSSQMFASAMTSLGISKDSHVVVYDNSYLFSACRVYWMFKVFGHKNVSILNGGLPKWLAEKRPVRSGLQDLSRLPPAKDKYSCMLHTKLVRRYDDIMDNTWAWINAAKDKTDNTGLEYVLDARNSERFQGLIPEPRPGIASGSIPHSVNTFWEDLVDKDKNTGAILLKSRDKLRRYFAKKKIDTTKPLVTSCGSGVTAAVVYVALREIGSPQVALFDGSWLEYAIHHDSPMDRVQPGFIHDPPTRPLKPDAFVQKFDARAARLERMRKEYEENKAKRPSPRI